MTYTEKDIRVFQLGVERGFIVGSDEVDQSDWSDSERYLFKRGYDFGVSLYCLQIDGEQNEQTYTSTLAYGGN